MTTSEGFVFCLTFRQTPVYSAYYYFNLLRTKTNFMKNTFLLAALLMSITHLSAQTKITSSTIGMMEARHIGPAVMGGRITAIDVVNANPRIMYVGSAGGGIWKSLTGGTFYKPIFEKN